MAGQATSISEIEGGARWVLIADDPTTAAGAGFVSLGRVVSYDRKPTLFRQHVRNEVDQIIESYGTTQGHTITLTMQRRSAEILAAMVSEYTDETTSRAMGTEYALLSGVTLCAVTDAAKVAANPDTNLTTEWFPNVVCTDIGNLVNQIVNGDDKPTYTVTFETQTKATDPAGQALVAKYRGGWAGDPDDAISEASPAPYVLPTHTTW